MKRKIAALCSVIVAATVMIAGCGSGSSTAEQKQITASDKMEDTRQFGADGTIGITGKQPNCE